MRLIVLAEAEQEFLDDATHLERKEEGLGALFRNEVAAVVDWIQQNHSVPSLRLEGYRRVNLRVFPYYVAYIVRDDVIWVVAIAHSFRRPEYWIGRIN